VKTSEEFLEKRESLLYIFTLVGTIFVLIFAILNLIDGKLILGIFEVFMFLALPANVLIYKWTKNFKLFSTVFLTLAFSIFIMLIITGGYRGHGIFWIYAFPLLAFFLNSIKEGFLWSFISLLSGVILSFLSNKGIIKIYYSAELLFEAFSSYIAIIFFAYFYSSILNSLIEKLRYRAMYDPLTLTYSRYYTYDFLFREIEKIKRRFESNMCIVYMDLDNFKYVNDSFGHNAGDMVLKSVAHLLKSNFRKADVIGRIGGDEFLIIVSNCKKEYIVKKLEELRKFIEEEFYRYKLSFSYGIVSIPEESVNIEEAIVMADKRMYKNKEIRKKRRKI